MNDLLPYVLTNVTLVLAGFATLAIAIALVSGRRSRTVELRRSRDL